MAKYELKEGAGRTRKRRCCMIVLLQIYTSVKVSYKVLTDFQ